jgi:hypothetical protein
VRPTDRTTPTPPPRTPTGFHSHFTTNMLTYIRNLFSNSKIESLTKEIESLKEQVNSLKGSDLLDYDYSELKSSIIDDLDIESEATSAVENYDFSDMLYQNDVITTDNFREEFNNCLDTEDIANDVMRILEDDKMDELIKSANNSLNNNYLEIIKANVTDEVTNQLSKIKFKVVIDKE